MIALGIHKKMSQLHLWIFKGSFCTLVLSISGGLFALSINFLELSNRANIISLTSVITLFYGICFGWIEGGYILFNQKSIQRKKNLISIAVAIRLAGIIGATLVFKLSGLTLVDSGVNGLEAMLYMTCLSMIPISRSDPMKGIAWVYLGSLLISLVVGLALGTSDSIIIYKLYCYSAAPSVIMMLCLSSKISIRSLRVLVRKIRGFIFVSPCQSIIANSDKVILATIDGSFLVAYSQIKSLMSIAKEVIRHLKNAVFRNLILESHFGRGVKSSRLFLQRSSFVLSAIALLFVFKIILMQYRSEIVVQSILAVLSLTFAASIIFDVRSYNNIAICMAKKVDAYWLVEVKATLAYCITVSGGILLIKLTNNWLGYDKGEKFASMPIIAIIIFSTIVYLVSRDMMGKKAIDK